MNSIGATIRTLRTRIGLSQEELAQLAGMSQGQVSRLERDRAQVIRPQLLVRLASVLGVSPSALLPGTTAWRDAPSADDGEGAVFRVGYWESILTAPVMAVADDSLTATRLSSRTRAGSLYTLIAPDIQQDPLSRPLTPRELVRALRSTYYDAILVPRDVLMDYQEELIECAQVAIAVDGVHVGVCTDRDGAAQRSSARWDLVRDASLASPLPVYFPIDAGAVGVVYRLRDALEGRVEVRGIPLEQWPTFWADAGEAVSNERPVLVVAPEPHLDSWRRSVWESNCGPTTSLIDAQDIWPYSPPALRVLSLIFRREGCEAWLKKHVVYEFLDAVERQAEEIRRTSPPTLTLIADRLGLAVPSILRECARCDFTTRFAPRWVAHLRA